MKITVNYKNWNRINTTGTWYIVTYLSKNVSYNELGINVTEYVSLLAGFNRLMFLGKYTTHRDGVEKVFTHQIRPYF